MGVKELAERIKTGRLSRGLTQGQLAEMIGVAPSTVGMWEQARREPNLNDLEAISDVYNVPMSYFVMPDDVRRMPEDMTQRDYDRLEALHQNPRLGMLFDRQRGMSDADIDMMFMLAERILKERDGE